MNTVRLLFFHLLSTSSKFYHVLKKRMLKKSKISGSIVVL